MRIVFRQVGGFAGLTLVAEVEARQLSREAAAEARRLLRDRPTAGTPAESGGRRDARAAEAQAGRRSEGRGRSPAANASADLLAYEITISEHSRHITLQFDALDVPPEAHALVDELREAATGEGPPSMSQPRKQTRHRKSSP